MLIHMYVCMYVPDVYCVLLCVCVCVFLCVYVCVHAWVCQGRQKHNKFDQEKGALQTIYACTYST